MSTVEKHELALVRAAVEAVRALHVPEWFPKNCPTPNTGCDRDDCWYDSHHESGVWRHERGYQQCEHCTGLGDGWPYEVPWPCPTIRAIDEAYGGWEQR